MDFYFNYVCFFDYILLLSKLEISNQTKKIKIFVIIKGKKIKKEALNENCFIDEHLIITKDKTLIFVK